MQIIDMWESLFNIIKNSFFWFLEKVFSVVFYFFPDVNFPDVDWSSLADSMAFVNTFLPVKEFFGFLTTYIIFKSSIWTVKVLIHLL